ncbi:hypothetical protein [Micrococcus porci]|uniref:hypothetical protein n=1 Tax=Micrococcus porci TaxID=2856555 RepID=UPI003CF3205F
MALGMSSCAADNFQASGPSMSPSGHSEQYSDNAHSTFIKQSSSGEASLDPPSSNAGEEITFRMRSVSRGKDKLQIPSELFITIPKKQEAFTLNIPTCPSSIFNITVVNEGKWQAMPSDLVAGDGCSSQDSHVQALHDTIKSLFDDTVTVSRKDGTVLITDGVIEMILEES